MWTFKKKFKNAAANPKMDAFRKFMMLREDYKADKASLAITKQSKYLIPHILRLRKKLRELHAEYNSRWIAIAEKHCVDPKMFEKVNKPY